VLVVTSILTYVLVMRQQASRVGAWSLYLPDISSLVFGHVMLALAVAVVFDDGYYFGEAGGDGVLLLPATPTRKNLKGGEEEEEKGTSKMDVP